jgi:hypothetical protein
VLGGVVLAWGAVLALVLTHSIFVSHDTVSNYGHVWYIASRLWHAHRLPFAMPVLGHGKALAFPYAFVPWLTAALLWPLFGNWAVTLCLVAGVVAAATTTFFAFPELRRGWWAAIVLVNPILAAAALIGQLPFLWAASFLFAAIGCWRRGRKGWATALAAVAQITHPAVVLPITAAIVAVRALSEPERRSLLARYAVSLVLAAPAAALVFLTPAFTDSSTGVKVWAFFGTVTVRACLLGLPFLLLLARRAPSGWIAPAIFLVVLAPNVLVDTVDTHTGWRALRHGPDTGMLAFVQSSAFTPGATYRVLRAFDSKIGMYQLIQHGARLDSEFFPESIVRRSWPDVAEYTRFLTGRHVDYVLAFDGYSRRYGTNEISLLRQVAGCADHVTGGPGYELFRVGAPC